jgi:CelD/BcsL family acetyltransferase involved in cellulose biosynthesis
MARRDELRIRTIRDAREWDAIRPAWDALHAACRTASTALDFAWLRTWWDVYGDVYGRDGLRIVTAWRGQGLAAVLPAYVHTSPVPGLAVRCLRFVATGEAEHEEICSDYLDLLCRPDDGAEAAEVVWREIEALAWDCVEWVDVPADSPLLVSGRHPGAARFSRGSCPIADLEGGFEAYLGRLSANGRQQARRLMREGEKAGARLELVGADAASAAFEDLRRLHQARWAGEGQPGAFAAERFVAFHRRIVARWLPEGRAVLGRLWLGEEPAAVLYGFVTAGKFDFYQSGVRTDAGGPLRSPGNLAHLLLMQALAARGVLAYDFLRGASAYKDRLATRQAAIAGLRIWRTTPRSAAARAWQFAARRLRRTARNGAAPC